jgi:hypothetical protein
MFEPTNNVVVECDKSVYKTIDELEQENKWLHDEKMNLLDIEAKLQARVSLEVETRNMRLKNSDTTLSNSREDAKP